MDSCTEISTRGVDFQLVFTAGNIEIGHALCIQHFSRQGQGRLSNTTQEVAMKWSKPSFEDIRFGFEITMYIATR
jgi:coenzyme PQQ precursor peptide PqqA